MLITIKGIRPQNAKKNRIFVIVHNRASRQTRQQLRRLTAMSAAKHLTGSKNPNKKLVEKAAKVIGLDSGPRIGGQFLDKKKRREKRKRRKKTRRRR